MMPPVRMFLLRSRLSAPQKDDADVITQRCSIGDWLLVDFLSKNMDTMVFSNVVSKLAKELEYGRKHSLPVGESTPMMSWFFIVFHFSFLPIFSFSNQVLNVWAIFLCWSLVLVVWYSYIFFIFLNKNFSLLRLVMFSQRTNSSQSYNIKKIMSICITSSFLRLFFIPFKNNQVRSDGWWCVTCRHIFFYPINNFSIKNSVWPYFFFL